MVLTTGSSTASPRGMRKRREPSVSVTPSAGLLDARSCGERVGTSMRSSSSAHSVAQRCLERGEVDHRALVVHRAAGAQADPVVVAVEAFAAPLVDGEVGGAEADVGARELEAGLHGCVP